MFWKNSRVLYKNEISLPNTIHIPGFLKGQSLPDFLKGQCKLLVWDPNPQLASPLNIGSDESLVPSLHRESPFLIFYPWVYLSTLTALTGPRHQSAGTLSLSRSTSGLCHFSAFAQNIPSTCDVFPQKAWLSNSAHPSTPRSKDSSSLFSLELNVRINFSFSFIHSFIQQLRRECLPHGRHSRLNNVEQNEDPAFLELTFRWGKQMLNKMNKWVNPRENQRVVSVMEKHTEQDTEDGGNG